MAFPTFDKSMNRIIASGRMAPLSYQPESSYVDLSSLNQVTDTVIGLAKEAKQRNDSIWALKQMSELREASNIHQMESQQTYVPGSGGYIDGELRFYKLLSSKALGISALRIRHGASDASCRRPILCTS